MGFHIVNLNNRVLEHEYIRTEKELAFSDKIRRTQLSIKAKKTGNQCALEIQKNTKIIATWTSERE